MRHVADPYRALGVARGASDAEIKAAHRRLAKRYHPDAASGETERFLAVQAAYQLLSDPLQRREWDARHAPGPVRASQRAQARPRAANGRWTKGHEPGTAKANGSRTEGATAAGSAGEQVGRDPASRTYTWSASEVPWWEDPGPRHGTRQAGRKAARATSSKAATGGAARADGRADAGTGRPAADAEPVARSDNEADRLAREAARARQDFDVYSRSSGAAWSMAARAYFRRAEADLPRRGSFQRQGSQPLTAARARMAAEEEARRARMTAEQGTSRASSTPATSGPSSSPRDRASAARTRAPSAPRAPAAARAGVARDARTIGDVRAAARERLRAARWPSLGERLLYALLAWIPLAVAIGYGGAWLSGCDRAALGCPETLPVVQAVAIALSLGLLVALPRLAYALAVAAAGLLLAAIALVVAMWAVGLRPPLSPSVLALSSALLLMVHLAVAGWVLTGTRGRPWAAVAERRWGRER